jgi:hypothetical protein
MPAPNHDHHCDWCGREHVRLVAEGRDGHVICTACAQTSDTSPRRWGVSTTRGALSPLGLGQSSTPAAVRGPAPHLDWRLS